MEATQGAHHVAQKSTTTTLPRRLSQLGPAEPSIELTFNDGLTAPTGSLLRPSCATTEIVDARIIVIVIKARILNLLFPFNARRCKIASPQAASTFRNGAILVQPRMIGVTSPLHSKSPNRIPICVPYVETCQRCP